jgi:hypothetical protein
MRRLSHGAIPDTLKLDGPYRMRLCPSDLVTVASIVNQGIDSHLEAVITSQNGNVVHIMDAPSMRCFLRRCAESSDENAQLLASDIMGTLGYEWV